MSNLRLDPEGFSFLTVDHRLMEGVHFGKMQKMMVKYFESPVEE